MATLTVTLVFELGQDREERDRLGVYGGEAAEWMKPMGSWLDLPLTQNQPVVWFCFQKAAATAARLLQVMPDSLQSSRLQPARLLCLWDSPGKNTGVGCLPSSRESSQPRN